MNYKGNIPGRETYLDFVNLEGDETFDMACLGCVKSLFCLLPISTNANKGWLLAYIKKTWLIAKHSDADQGPNRKFKEETSRGFFSKRSTRSYRRIKE